MTMLIVVMMISLHSALTLLLLGTNPHSQTSEEIQRMLGSQSLDNSSNSKLKSSVIRIKDQGYYAASGGLTYNTKD
jgi:hypothetical protein